MTCIVGIEHDDSVTIGGDSCASNGYSRSVRADEKVFRNGLYVFGFTSSFRMGQILRYSFTPPEPNEIEVRDLDRFIASKFVDSMRTALKAGGYTRIENGVETSGTFLLGIGARLYTLQGDHQVARHACGYDAVGSGGDVAVGAMHALASVAVASEHADTSPEIRVRLALSAAAEFSPFVAAPFHTLTTKPLGTVTS